MKIKIVTKKKLKNQNKKIQKFEKCINDNINNKKNVLRK